VSCRQIGLTLVEILIGAVILSVAITALLGAFVSQITLNEHARNLTWAVNDASRMMEQIRRQNSGGACAAPSVNPPAGFGSWDAWLTDTTVNGGGGKSIQPNPAVNELMVVTSQGVLPLTVTVAVCWRHRNRTLGECTWNGAVLVPNPGAGGDLLVTESPAMLSTLMACRR
jgi:type II secretory pathway pseudopilin PulG